MYRSLYAIGIVFLFLLTSCGNRESNEITGYSLSLYRPFGSVYIQRGTGADFTARAGLLLHDGYALFTGQDSYCLVQIDTSSLVKLDEESRVGVAQIGTNTLSLVVEAGQLLVDIPSGQRQRDVEIRISNTIIGIRGTRFVAGFDNDGWVRITMIRGNVDVDDRHLIEGYVMRISPDGEIYEIFELLPEEANEFTLQALDAEYTPDTPYLTSIDFEQAMLDVLRRHSSIFITPQWQDGMFVYGGFITHTWLDDSIEPSFVDINTGEVMESPLFDFTRQVNLYGEPRYVIASDFRLYDLNNDGIPEIFIIFEYMDSYNGPHWIAEIHEFDHISGSFVTYFSPGNTTFWRNQSPLSHIYDGDCRVNLRLFEISNGMILHNSIKFGNHHAVFLAFGAVDADGWTHHITELRWEYYEPERWHSFYDATPFLGGVELFPPTPLYELMDSVREYMLQILQ